MNRTIEKRNSLSIMNAKVFLIASSFLVPVAAFAQALPKSNDSAAMDSSDMALTEGKLDMQTLVVSATRVAIDKNAINRPVAVINAQQINRIQPQSVAQVVQYEPNVAIEGGPRSGNQSVSIRGLGDNKVLQTIDGVRQVFDSGHRPSYFLDPVLLKSVEVVKGPVSALWGSGALGGVVAQNTISAGDILSGTQNLGGIVKTGYNSNNDQSTTTAVLAGRSDSIDWLLSSYYRDANDLELGNGDALEGSATRDQGGLFKATWQVDESQALGINYRQAEARGSVPSNGSAPTNTTSNFLLSREISTQNAILDYALDTESPLINSQLSTYWNHVEVDESRLSDGREDTTELDVYGFSANNQSRFQSFSLLYGLDGYTEDFSTQRSGANRPNPPEAKTDVWGAFVQTNVDLAQTWSMELGVRYDSFETEAENLSTKRDDDDVSPTIAVTWQALDNLQLTLRHDQAFRAPSSEELYTTGTHFCMGSGFCNTFVSNPDLESEQAANTELLVKYTSATLANGGQFHTELSVFENRVDNFIEQIVTAPSFGPVMDPGFTTWVNVDEATIKGTEITTRYTNGGYQAKLSYGQVRGKDDQTKEDLTGIPADTISLDVSQAWMSEQLTTGLRLTKTQSQTRTHYAENTANTRYDAYAIADLYTSWNPDFIADLSVDLSVNNLTDRYYRRAWQELYESGREVIVSTNYRF